MSNFQPTAEHVIAARRKLASDSLADFACMIDIPSAPITDAEDEDTFSIMKLDSLAAHHELLCHKLQDLAEGVIDNLMIMCPPGSAKSTYVDVVFVPWFMAKYPRKNVIVASYAANIARKQGRRARQVLRSKAFGNLFPGVGVSAASSAADEWALTTGGEYMAGGLLGGLTGNRAALGILDDPIAGREEAESENNRNKVWDAYTDDFCSRLIPGAPQVMILTRWHEEDPAGRILPEGWKGESGLIEGRDGRTWYVLCLPAICDRDDDPLGRRRGETLWPEWFSLDHWKPFQRNPRTWASLYQQRPSPDEGSYFQRNWFNRFEERDLPRSVRYVGTSDYAVSEGKGDYTALRVWAIDNHEPANIWMVDGWRGQTTSDLWIENQIDLIERYRQAGGSLTWYGEAGVIQKSIEPMLTRRMRERRVSCRIVWLPSSTDKASRARSAQALAREGRINIRDDMDGDCFIDECTAFPSGKHDDDVDNLSLLGRVIDQISAPKIVRPKPKPRVIPRSNAWMGA